jgi:formamidopyrimidine-DNA glycosylase
MPELPEVQTIVNDLNKKIVGYMVADFWSDWPKAIKNKSLADFQKEINGRKILNIRRVGKNIFIDLSGSKTLYIHLKMTGHLLVKSSKLKSKSSKNYFNDKVNQYIHHIWKLEAKSYKLKATLEFSDVRKFAKIVLDDTDKISELKEIKKLGPDVMDKKFTLGKFEEILNSRKHRTVGTVLMEQELMSGIGNIYRSEILFESGVLPQRKISSLKADEKRSIYKNIRKVLKKATRLRGTSDSDYRDTTGAPGSFQKVLKVYRKAGKICPKCGTIIKRAVLGQRSVFYCPVCQK